MTSLAQNRFVRTTLCFLGVSLTLVLGWLLPGGSSEAPRTSLTSAFAAEVTTIDPSIRDFKLPSQIPWKKGENGSESAVLYGDPRKPGLYVQLLRRGPNVWSKPHYHTNDRFITVLEGT